MNQEITNYPHLTNKLRESAFIKSTDEYYSRYKESLDDSDSFWSKMASEHLSWFNEWNSVLQDDLENGKVQWFGGGVLNACYNCVDRHLPHFENKEALVWISHDMSRSRSLSYGALYKQVNKLAFVLKSMGVAKGDRVILVMPIIPELVISMLACARIGAVHCTLYSGLGTQSLSERIQDSGARLVITAGGMMGDGRFVSLSARLEEALAVCPDVQRVVEYHSQGGGSLTEVGNHRSLSELTANVSDDVVVECEPMSAEDMLFILYASFAVGKPKGLVHTHAGYLLWAAMTTRLVFNLKEEDVFWSTGDIGRHIGHTFSVYGALLNRVTSVLWEGCNTRFGIEPFLEIISKYNVTKFCTIPSTIRRLAHQDAGSERTATPSLEMVGSTGEVLDPKTWKWFSERFASNNCPVVNMWWQSESGGPLLATLPVLERGDQGSVGAPLFGVQPLVLDLDTGEEVRFPNQEGAFFIGRPWPGMARRIWNDEDAFRDAYLAPFGNLFITGQGAKRDEHGNYWLTGRIDDVISTDGHRIGVWEVENVLSSHVAVFEATAAGFPHPTKGQGIYVFVTLSAGRTPSEELKTDLMNLLKEKLGEFAVPDVIQWATALPKTRSGKILRRLLQKIAAGETGKLGDLSTLAEPKILEKLIEDRLGIGTEPR